MEPAAPAVTAAPQSQDPKRLVLKNTMMLILGQVIATPLSMVVTAAMGRYLGPAFFGEFYIATAMTTFGFLLVDCGQGAGELLGSSLVWRLFASVVVYLILVLWSSFEDHSPHFQVILFLVTVQWVLMSLASASLEAVRGLERTDINTKGNILQPFLNLLVVVPVLVLGGSGRAALLAQAVVYALVLAWVWRAIRPVGIRPLHFRMATLKGLFKPGSAFLVFGLAMALQPIVDAKMLQYLKVPLDVMGWNLAARRLIGPLILPASMLIGALYPTLSRLHVEDRAAFISTLRSSIRGILILAVPIGLSCGLFADLGVLLFGKEKYGGSEANLMVMAPYLFLMYFSMPLGAAILAAQRQRAWAVVQSICVVVSVVLDPLLIPWFQRRAGNGGLGVCVSSAVSEVFMVGLGAAMVDPGTFDRSFFLALARCLAAGAALTAVAMLFRYLHLSQLLAAPVAVAAYFAALWAVGGLGGEQLAGLQATIKRKLSRR